METLYKRDLQPIIDDSLYPNKVNLIFGTRRSKPPKAFAETYPDAHFTLINQDNYLDFVY